MKMVFTPDVVKIVKDMIDFWYDEVADWDEEDFVMFLLDVANERPKSNGIEIEYRK